MFKKIKNKIPLNLCCVFRICQVSEYFLVRSVFTQNWICVTFLDNKWVTKIGYLVAQSLFFHITGSSLVIRDKI